MNNKDLIKKAASLVKPKKIKDRLFADVGCTLVSGNGKIYLGVCADTNSGGFCAEAAAIASMITDGEYRIKKIVAVWKDEKGKLYVISPCGKCRQMMVDIDEENIEAEVVLDEKKTMQLKELLPYHDWWKEQN